MSICIEKLPHSCGGKNSLQVFQNDDGKINGWCFKCSAYVDDPYENGSKAPDIRTEQKKKIRFDEVHTEITTFPTVSIIQRKLEKWALERYEVKVSLSEEDGTTPTACYFPFYKDGNLVKYLVRPLAQKIMWWIGEGKDLDLFGWNQAVSSGSKKLFITEGAYDAIALYQALKMKNKGTKWEDAEPAVISLINGVSSVKKDLTRFLPKIRSSFKEVVLCFDMDEPGRAAVETAMVIIPGAQAATLPEKDANECLMKGKAVALVNAVIFNATTPKNTRLVWGSSLHDLGRQQAQWGLSWPWQGMTKLTRGFRYGETYYFGAGVKMGKSELVNSLGSHFITEHNLKIFMAKPEEVNKKTYQLLCGKVVGKVFHDPEIQFDYDAYDIASDIIGDNVCMLNLYQHLDWSTLRSDIQVAASAGCKVIFIDPITNLSNGISSGEANTLLQEIAQDFAALVKDLELIGLIFCHLKSPEAGPAHERGGKVLSHQFAGSRAMMRSCNYMIGLEGNKDPDFELEERNLRRLVVLEDREFGASGLVNLYWDHKTSLFNEV